ncbi:MAG: hypothetical protein HFI20_09700 [Lachnospiraceae bacterium]|nr:hypothetical protein [Lachnospiraceae bacterium]
MYDVPFGSGAKAAPFRFDSNKVSFLLYNIFKGNASMEQTFGKKLLAKSTLASALVLTHALTHLRQKKSAKRRHSGLLLTPTPTALLIGVEPIE